MPVAAPLVSVIMTTYREQPWRLRRAIDSILNQDLRDLELIIVFEKDDGNFEAIRDGYDDSRLIVLRQSGNPGRNACHNTAMAMARGRFLACMDGDDVSYPDRLTKQVAFFAAHPEISLVGGSGRLIDGKGEIVGVRQFPLTHAEIMRAFALINPIFYSSAMLDRERVGYRLRYREKEHYSDDFDLWLVLLEQGHKFANLPDILIDYSQPEGYRRPKRHWRAAWVVRMRHWQLCLRYPRMFLGIGIFAGFALLPKAMMDLLSGRSQFSDRIRLIRQATPNELSNSSPT